MPEHQLGWSRAQGSWGMSVKLVLLLSLWFCRGVAGQQPGRPHRCFYGLSAVIMFNGAKMGEKKAIGTRRTSVLPGDFSSSKKATI